MANTINFVGYLRASGRNPNFRVFVVNAFTGNAGAANSEVLDFTKAGNPNGLEDAQTPGFTTSFVPPVILDSTLLGYKPELQIGGNGTTGQCGITFYNGTTALTSGAYPAAITGGQIIIGVMDNAG